jgi:hypothetical protein
MTAGLSPAPVNKWIDWSGRTWQVAKLENGHGTFASAAYRWLQYMQGIHVPLKSLLWSSHFCHPSSASGAWALFKVPNEHIHIGVERMHAHNRIMPVTAGVNDQIHHATAVSVIRDDGHCMMN